MSYFKIPAWSCDEILNEHLKNPSISTDMTELMNEALSIVDNLEEVNDSDLEIESLI